ncbi:MAG: histidine kinase [Bacillota bacterium]|nr:histidine kinase [Bacillota bacterium]
MKSNWLQKITFKINRSLIRKLVVILLCGTIIPTVLIAGISYLIIQKIIQDNASHSIRTSQGAMANSIEMMYAKLSTAADYMVFDDTLARLLMDEYGSGGLFDKYTDIRYLSMTLFPTQAVTLRHDSIFLVFDNQWNYYSNYSSENQVLTVKQLADTIRAKYLDQDVRMVQRLMWIGTEANLFPTRKLIFIRPLIAASGYKYGWLVFLVDDTMLKSIISSTADAAVYTNYITNIQGKIVYADLDEYMNRDLSSIFEKYEQNNQEYAYAELDGNRLMVSRNAGPDDTIIVSTVNTQYLLRDLRGYTLLVALLVTLLLALALMIELRILLRMTRTLRLVSEKAGIISQGDFNQRIDVTGDDEIAALAHCMNDMTVQIQSLFQDAIQQEQEAVKLEINVYQTRLNPHFLLNTLNALKWMAVAQKMEPMVDAMSWLGSILESAIRNNTGFVRVREEIELLQCYININKLRYKDHFEVHFSLSEDVLELYTLNLILQPIVENAVFHGLGRKPRIDIFIDVRTNEEHLIFTITDTGVGMDEETLASVFDEKPGGRVGILACKKRIELRFQPPCGLTITSQLKKGTTVQVTLPVLREDPGTAAALRGM